jgi:Leucine-rich repeat (LRR) protein
MNPRLPETIGNLRALEKLVLYGAQDPRRAGDTGSQPGERHAFPRGMSQLKNLTYLDLGRNGLGEIPSFVGDLPNLREFRFQWNMTLRAVPAFIAHLRDLTILRLNANDLDDLPDVLSTLPHLARITLGNNCKITQNDARMKDLARRFPRVTFDFTDEYDCPSW